MVKFCKVCNNMMRGDTCPCQEEVIDPIDLIPKFISGEIRLEINGKPVKVHPDVIKKYKEDQSDFDIDGLYNTALKEFNSIIKGTNRGRKR